ncbi:MAG TPA: sigma-70 family RNA polymerase sigma factor [Acidimicrobiia bacterium]|nr:sigma-70 family RNA polymerase sigma factor [Acidimicrobiia bacterium]
MESSDTSEFEARLAAARAGDELAWRFLFRLVSGRVVAFLVSRGAPDPEAVAGDTFLDIVRSIRRFKGDQRAFVSWCLTIAHRRLVDAYRASSRRPETPADPVGLEKPETEDVEEVALGLVGATRVRRLLDELTPDQADVLALRIYGEMTLPEVAEQLGKPLTAVTSLQHRGLAALRRRLGDADSGG